MRVGLGAFAILLAGMTLGAQETREGSVPRDGFDLHYRVYGAGSPVLLISGGPGFDCDYLRPVAEEIAKTNRVILVELRGTGRSMPPVLNKETINGKLIVADFEAIRTQIDVQKWIVVGHSAGAVMAMFYASAYPERITSMVLLNSGPMRIASAAAQVDNVLMRLTPEERDALAKSDQRSIAKVFKYLLPGYFYDRSKTPALAAVMTPESVHGETSALLGADLMGPKVDLRPGLKDFAKPVLVLAGRQDPLDPVVQIEIHETLKNSTLRLLDRCGHFAWIEQPEQCYKILHEFLAGVG